MSIGGSKGGSDSKSSNQYSNNSTGSFTPNNLDALKTGWNAADQVLGSANWGGLVGQGASAIQNAAPTATALNNTAAGTATNFANGNYVNNPANQFLTPIANGSQLSSGNPAFQGMVDQMGRALQPQVDGNFAASGRYGSGANANAFASALTNETGQLAYQNYNDAANRQIQATDLLGNNFNTGYGQQLTAAGMTPNVVNSLFAPGAALGTAGYAGPAAYQNIIATGNPGGTQTGTSNGTGSGTESGTNWNVGAKASVGNMFGNGG